MGAVKNWVYKGDNMGRQHYKDMNFKTAMHGENPFGKKFPYFGTNQNYKGYNPFYQGTDKTSFLGKDGYLRQGAKSLGGVYNPSSNIGGGTTGSRYLYEKAANAGNFLKSGLRFASGPFMFGASLFSPSNSIMSNDMEMKMLREQSGGEYGNPYIPQNNNVFSRGYIDATEQLANNRVVHSKALAKAKAQEEAKAQAKARAVAQMGSGLTGLNPMHTSGPTTVIKKAPVPTNIWNTVPATHDAVVNAGGDFGGGGGSDFGGGSSGGGFSNGNIWI